MGSRVITAHHLGEGTDVADQREAVAPLLAASARRPAAVIIGACAAVTVLIGALTWHGSRPGSLDQAVDSWIRGHLGMHVHALSLLEDLGSPVQVTVATVVIVLACLAARRLNGALLAGISVLVASGLTELVLKPFFGRTLDGALVYPSGHTCGAFTLAAIIAVLLLSPPRPARVVVVVIAGLAACSVAVAMIGLGYHYFTDTVGGAAVGVGVVLATTFPLDMQGTRRLLRIASASPQQPAKPDSGQDSLGVKILRGRS